MTRPTQNALVLDGNEIKIRLLAERTESQSHVHIDWLRFTVQRRHTPAPSIDALFPPAGIGHDYWDERLRSLLQQLSKLPDADTGTATEAFDLAADVASEYGPDFVACPEPRKGHDFYKHRISIERNGVEVGWVGFGSSSDSPRQAAQAKTLHVNMYGAACTFGAHGWNQRLATLIDARKGNITRCDLALDFFDGMPGGIQRVWDDWGNGLCDVGGKRPKHTALGPWADPNGRGRSFYIGSKEAGKQTNAYEKGDQLFGTEAGSPWVRVELRYGNKLRVLSTDMLRRPADFFAGASEWHAAILAEADVIVVPEPVRVTARLAIQTVQAECARVYRHLRDNCSAALAFGFKHLNENEFLDLVTSTKLPGRLRSFSPSECADGIARALDRFTTARDPGQAYA